jgi:hypothetical protein
VRSVDLDWDWSAVYGDRWGFLHDAPLYSSVLAVGSEVRVYSRNTISVSDRAGGSAGLSRPE